jgi:hypothetical protein
MTIYGKIAKDVLQDNYPEYEGMSDNEQIKTNHEDCPAGTDNKQRLYIKNIDGAYLMHCHHCGMNGYYRPRETLRRIMEKPGSYVTKEDPTDWSFRYYESHDDYDSFDTRGQLWLSRYGFNEKMVDMFGIRENDRGIVLPIFNGIGDLAGYQVRNYEGHPKYLTFTSFGYSMLYGFNEEVKPWVIVEDLLSSYKLNAAGYPTMCLLGTKLGNVAKAKLVAEKPNRVVVWLDDDMAGHSAAVTLLRELGALTNVTSIINKQPKDVPLADLMGIDL